MPPRNPGESSGDQLWKSDQEWILLFDNLMKYSSRKKKSNLSPTLLTSVTTSTGGHQYHPSSPSTTTGSSNSSKRSSNITSLNPTPQQHMTLLSANNTPSLLLLPRPTESTKVLIPRSKEMPLSSSASHSSNNNVGGVEAENFIESFLDVPRISNVVSGPAVEQEMNRISQVLADVSVDWSKRVDALKRLRSVVLAGGDIYKEFYSSLRFVDVSLICSVKDLRSQVVRETCVTLAFLSQQLGHKFERTAEVILPSLIALIPNSAKIVSTSGIVTIRFIIQNTHSHRLIPIIVNHLQTSRSRDVRRYCCEFIKHIIFVWPRESLEKHAVLLQEAIKRGITDADPEARSLSRQAYWHFSNVFPSHAEVLISQLDASSKKSLEDGRVNPLQTQQQQQQQQQQIRFTPPRDLSMTRSASRTRKNSESDTEGNGSSYSSVVPVRSSSAIDPDAARRAATARTKSNLTPSSLRQPSSTSGLATPLRSRKSFATPSTPSSRTTSPAFTPTPVRMGISRSAMNSRDNSRDNSPERRIPEPKKTPSSRSSSATRKSQPDHRGYQSDDDNENNQFGSQSSLIGGNTSAHRYSYSTTEILTLLGSPNWSSRKEGLLGLQIYLRSGTLYPAEVDNVRLLLTRMMSDPTTKVFSIFLDTLYDFINVHKLDLGSWLYTLLTRLFGKMSVDLLPSVQGKIDKCLELIRGSFATENQFQQLLKFVNDQMQTPNLKVKAAFLTYLFNLIKNNMAASDFKNTSAVRIGVTKLVNWSVDAKTPELRRASQNVLIALHELNAGEFTSMLALMDEFLRDTALKMISGTGRRDMIDSGSKSRSSSVSSRNGSRTDLSSLTNPMRKAEKSIPIASSPQSQTSNDENINPEDFYACLRQTTQAIEKFSTLYAQPNSNLDYSSGEEGQTGRPPRNPGSEDSGFSRTSMQNAGSAAALDSSEHSSQNGDSLTAGTELNPLETGEPKELSKHLVDLKGLLNTSPVPGNSNEIIQELQTALAHSEEDVILSALDIVPLCTTLQLPNVESLLPLVQDLQNDDNPLVAESADKVLLTMLETIPILKLAHILSSKFLHDEEPGNAKAASLILSLVQKSQRDVLDKSLAELLPPIVQGFSTSTEPNIRKDCMLSIIEIQQKIGPEAVFPYIQNLPINKIKLLNLYLQRK